MTTTCAGAQCPLLPANLSTATLAFQTGTMAGLLQRRFGAATTIIVVACMTPSTAKQPCTTTKRPGPKTKSLGVASIISWAARSQPPQASAMTARLG